MKFRTLFLLFALSTLSSQLSTQSSAQTAGTSAVTKDKNGRITTDLKVPSGKTLTIEAGATLDATGATVTGITAGATPGGSDTQLQFNDAGSLGANSGLSYNKTSRDLTVAGSATISGATMTAPATPSVSQVGSAGSTAYTYKIAARMTDGRMTQLSSAGTTATGNATLTGSNYNSLSWSAYSGADAYYVYRTASSGSPSTLGLLDVITGTTYNDTATPASDGPVIPSAAGAGRLGLDVLRVGNYTGDNGARVGIEGDFDAHGAVGSSGVDGYWTSGKRVEMQFIGGIGNLLAYDRDSSPAHFLPLALNYNATEASVLGNGYDAPVMVNTPAADGAHNFIVRGQTMLGARAAGIVYYPSLGSKNLDVTSGASVSAQDGGAVISMSGGFDTGSINEAVFGAIGGHKENGTNANRAGYLAFYTLASGGTEALERARITSAGLLDLKGQIYGRGTGTNTLAGRLLINHDTAGDTSASINNISATGYGLSSRGGSASTYIAQFTDYAGAEKMTLASTGLTVQGTITSTGALIGSNISGSVSGTNTGDQTPTSLGLVIGTNVAGISYANAFTAQNTTALGFEAAWTSQSTGAQNYAVNKKYYITTFTTNSTMTITGTPATGSTVSILLKACNGTATFTYPTAQRLGDVVGTSTVITPTAGDHLLRFEYVNSLWYFTDTITTANPAFTTIELGAAATDTTLSRSAAGVMAVEGVVVPSISSTNTLTNKRVTPRITAIGSGATPTINTDNCDVVNITGLAVAITSMTTNLTGTPVEFDQLEFRITGTAARAITWGAKFVAGPTALPTTTVTTKALHVWFEWDTVLAAWVCMSSGSDA